MGWCHAWLHYRGRRGGTETGRLSLAAYKPVVHVRVRPWLSPWIGLFTGLVSGATGVFVFPAVPYLNSINLDKESLIQALGLTFTVSSAALAVAHLGGHADRPKTAAQAIARYVSQTVFDQLGSHWRGHDGQGVV